jgi:hypothetical protein
MKYMQQLIEFENTHHQQDVKTREHRFSARLKRAFKPMIPGLILDGADLITFGPLGVYLGLIVGCPAGYWMCSKYQLPFLKRILGAIIAGVYCSLPFTGFIPAATLVTGYAKFLAPPKRERKRKQ